MSVDTSTVSFDHDGRIVISGWPLSATDRTSSPYVSDIVTIAHRDNVGIYGDVFPISSGDEWWGRWEPTTHYETTPHYVAQADGYEGVFEPCLECDHFVQLFFEANFGIDFPDDWWKGTALEMCSGLPDGFECISDSSLCEDKYLQPGDGLAIHVGGAGHAAVVHSTEGGKIILAEGLYDPNNPGHGVDGNIVLIREKPSSYVTFAIFRYVGPSNVFRFVPISNYERRQVLVASQAAPEPVPQAYITRRHSYYTHHWTTIQEYPESVYCWLGWRYLYVYLAAPSPRSTRLQTTITFRRGQYWDNHRTDSSRQTEYEYAAGQDYTLTYDAPVAEGVQEICVDIGEIQSKEPMQIVTGIRLEFADGDDWQINEPKLCLDRGDLSSSPPRDPATPHCYLKEFEHWQYRRGGMSACVDGQYLEGIAWPDSSHGNTLEPTGGHFDYRVGATSGIDFTSAWSLAGYLDFIERCSDAWDTTYSAAAAEAAFKDDEGNWLKTPHCFDLRPVNRQTGTTFDVAVRVGQWTTAAGLHYDFTAEKIVRGQAHGWMSDPTGAADRNHANADTLERRKQGSSDTWAEVQSLSSDGHGHWHSQSLETIAEYSDDVATFWNYRVDSTYALAHVREYATMQGASAGGHRFSLLVPRASARLIHFYSTLLNGIYHLYSNPEVQYWEDASEVDPGYTNPHQDTTGAGDDYPSAFFTERGRLHLCFVRDNIVYTQHSDDLGETWSTSVSITSGYSTAFFWRAEDNPIVYFAGVKSDGTLDFAYSTDTLTTLEDAVTVASGVDVRQASGVMTQRGRIVIVYSKGGEETVSYSDDGGVTFQEA